MPWCIFAKHKKGIIFKKVLPIEKLASYQTAPLDKPLLKFIERSQDKKIYKESLKNFEDILMYTGVKAIKASLARFHATVDVTNVF